MTSKEEIRLALADLRVEAKQLMNNTMILINELDNVETEEDYKKFDEMADRLTSGFKHIEIF
jgi:hypothetical protein